MVEVGIIIMLTISFLLCCATDLVTLLVTDTASLTLRNLLIRGYWLLPLLVFRFLCYVILSPHCLLSDYILTNRISATSYSASIYISTDIPTSISISTSYPPPLTFPPTPVPPPEPCPQDSLPPRQLVVTCYQDGMRHTPCSHGWNSPISFISSSSRLALFFHIRTNLLYLGSSKSLMAPSYNRWI